MGLALGLGLGLGLGSELARVATHLQPQPPVTKRAQLQVERAPCWQAGHGVCAPRENHAAQLGGCAVLEERTRARLEVLPPAQARGWAQGQGQGWG